MFKTKTKANTFIFVLEAPREQDYQDYKDYKTGWKSNLLVKFI